jgi:carbamoylphosphate synthase large subunit
MITLGYSRASAPSAQRIAEASDGRIELVRSWDADVNWGRRTGRGLNADITNAVNKRRSRELFAEHDIPAPRFFTSDEAREAVRAGITVLGRPDFHTRRQGFWVCRSEANIDRALRGRGRKRPASHFIEWVEMDREFRVHQFQGRTTRISQKLPDPVDPMKYTTIKPTIENRDHIRKAARRAVRALGLDFGTVDLFADDEQVFVLEVNTAPGLGGTTPRLWADTFINHLEGGE